MKRLLGALEKSTSKNEKDDPSGQVNEVLQTLLKRVANLESENARLSDRLQKLAPE